VTVTYSITDGVGAPVQNTVTLLVTGADDQPTISALNAGSVSEDGAAVAINLLAGAADADGDTLAVSGTPTAVSNTGRAVAFTLSGSTLSIDPAQFNDLDSGESETVTVTYTITDGDGAPVQNTVTLLVTGADDQPTISALNAGSVSEDGAAVAINLLAGAADADGDTLAVSGTPTAATAGGKAVTFSLAGGTLSLDPAQFNALSAGQQEVITISYLITDGDGAGVANTASLVVTGVNDGPTAVADGNSAVEDGAAASGNVLANDTDPDAADTLAVAKVNGAAGSVGTAVQGLYGTLTLNADGSYSYSADGDLLDTLSGSGTLTDSFTYTISDGQGGTSTATLAVAVSLADDNRTITGTNQADTISGDQGGAGAEDTIWGGNSGDTLSGLAGADILHGENGDDVLSGGSGRDKLYGGNGKDSLSGGTGDDLLAGGLGNDLLAGGAGNDIFVFGQASGHDTITDFGAGDKIMFEDGVSVRSSVLEDTNGDGVLDLTLHLSSGSVTLLGVTEYLGADAFFP
jgi:VCBS repeat-containing protein